jgi:hypothetical protein
MTAHVLVILLALSLASCARPYQPMGCEYCSAGLQQLRIGQ